MLSECDRFCRKTIPLKKTALELPQGEGTKVALLHGNVSEEQYPILWTLGTRAERYTCNDSSFYTQKQEGEQNFLLELTRFWRNRAEEKLRCAESPAKRRAVRFPGWMLSSEISQQRAMKWWATEGSLKIQYSNALFLPKPPGNNQNCLVSWWSCRTTIHGARTYASLHSALIRTRIEWTFVHGCRDIFSFLSGLEQIAIVLFWSIRHPSNLLEGLWSAICTRISSQLCHDQSPLSVGPNVSPLVLLRWETSNTRQWSHTSCLVSFHREAKVSPGLC